MGVAKLSACGGLLLTALFGHEVAADPASARYVCKDFLQRSGYVARSWGEWHSWTTVRNQDGSWSVGAKFVGMPPGGQERNLYVTCVMTKKGDKWTLEQLSRLR